METTGAVEALAALAQGTRLEVFRMLVQKGRNGAAAGDISARLELPAPTLSFHLAQLSRAKLLAARRDGRSIIYSANYATMTGLLAYLTENCCSGDAAPTRGGRGCVPARRRRTSAQSTA
ncbi:MAG: ArsR/SmtB family transcription factor [Candidatus Binataceae bacterium]